MPELISFDGGYRIVIAGVTHFTLISGHHEWALRLLQLAQLAYRGGRLDKESEIQFAHEKADPVRAQKAQRKDKVEVTGTVSPIAVCKVLP